jgi:hypothetical protein
MLLMALGKLTSKHINNSYRIEEEIRIKKKKTKGPE